VNAGAIFQGQALNAVDAKGRVSVPASFRSLIEERARRNDLDPANNTLMIGEHANGQCLTALDAVSSAEIDQQLVESVADLPAAQRMAALEAARMDAFGSLEPVKFDGAGRMVLSPILRKLGAIDELAYFIGAGSSFQIWNPKKALAAFEGGSRNHNRLVLLLEERGVAL
jgi:MraZ protein